ncbi:MAG: DUF3108 domain-containing protein [Gammaproteobacteria bacterium]
MSVHAHPRLPDELIAHMRPIRRTPATARGIAAGLALAVGFALAFDSARAEAAEPAGSPGNGTSAPCPQPFKITFDVEWHGMGAGTSTLQLARKSATEYTYRSNNVAKGLFRLAIPDTITQTSEFSIVDGKVRPSSYVGDDGSTDTDRDVSLKFDWIANRVTGIAEDKPVNQPLAPGVQDSLSVQVALMCALAVGQSPKSFRLIDKDEVKEYQYTHEGNATLDTPAGKLDTVIYTSQRAGASRLTRLWIAPSLGFLPVRAEQVKKGKRELQLKLQSVERG